MYNGLMQGFILIALFLIGSAIYTYFIKKKK